MKEDNICGPFGLGEARTDNGKKKVSIFGEKINYSLRMRGFSRKKRLRIFGHYRKAILRIK